jgi:agmatinase
MTAPTFIPPSHPFLGARHAKDLKKLDADATVFGAPHGTVYPGQDNRVFEDAPKSIRKAMLQESVWLDHYDFDLGGTLYPNGSKFRLADLGDLTTASEDGPGNRSLIEATARAILKAGSLPIMIGGDDSVPIPFIAAFEEAGPIHIVQVDAHIDWRKQRHGEPYGLSSTMRRASEMKHVKGITQVGMRSVGSARTWDVEAARKWGVEIVTARRVHEEGIGSVLKHVPKGAKVLFTIDCDAIDCSIMQAVLAPTPGGLQYYEILDLIAGITEKAQIVGFDMIELVPERDLTGNCAYVAGRIIAHAVGRIARAEKPKGRR